MYINSMHIWQNTIPCISRCTDPVLTPAGLLAVIIYVPMLLNWTLGISNVKWSNDKAHSVVFIIGVVTRDWLVKVQCMSSTSTGGAAFTILNCITTVLLMTSTIFVRPTTTIGGTVYGKRVNGIEQYMYNAIQTVYCCTFLCGDVKLSCRTTAYNCWGTYRTWVVGEGLQFCYNHPSIANCCLVYYIIFQSTYDLVVHYYTILISKSWRWPGECNGGWSGWGIDVLRRSTRNYNSESWSHYITVCLCLTIQLFCSIIILRGSIYHKSLNKSPPWKETCLKLTPGVLQKFVQ